MKMLGVKFSDSQHLKLDDIATMLGMSKTDIARAALYIGLNEILSLSSKDVDRGIEFASLNAVKAK